MKVEDEGPLRSFPQGRHRPAPRSSSRHRSLAILLVVRKFWTFSRRSGPTMLRVNSSLAARPSAAPPRPVCSCACGASCKVVENEGKRCSWIHRARQRGRSRLDFWGAYFVSAPALSSHRSTHNFQCSDYCVQKFFITSASAHPTTNLGMYRRKLNYRRHD